MRASLEQAVALERDEVMVHRRGGRQAHGIGDLADRGRVAALGHRPGDALDDLLLALRVGPRHIGLPWASRAHASRTSVLLSTDRVARAMIGPPPHRSGVP